CAHAALGSNYRGNDLLCAYDGTGVVGHVDIERGVHHLVRVIRCRVSHHRDLIAELSGKADGGFDAGMRDQSDDDELVDAVFLELQIQIRVGEAAGAPMLRHDNLAWLGLELGTKLATPGAIFEALPLPRCFLNGRDVLPGLVVTRPVSMMRHIEDAKLRLARGVQHLQHMRNAVIGFGDGANAVPYLASLGDEVVVRIDHQKASELPFVCSFCHERTCCGFPKSYRAASPGVVDRLFLSSGFKNYGRDFAGLRYEGEVACLYLDRFRAHALCHKALEI